MGLACQLTSWCQDDHLSALFFKIDELHGPDREGTRLSSSRLGLCDDICSLAKRNNGFLLNRRWLFKTEAVDAPQHIVMKAHQVEGRDRLTLSGLFHRLVVSNLIVVVYAGSRSWYSSQG